MAAVLFHFAEAWLIMASICGRLLLLGAVRLRFIWDFLDVTVSMTPGGGVDVLVVIMYMWTDSGPLVSVVLRRISDEC